MCILACVYSVYNIFRPAISCMCVCSVEYTIHYTYIHTYESNTHTTLDTQSEPSVIISKVKQTFRNVPDVPECSGKVPDTYQKKNELSEVFLERSRTFVYLTKHSRKAHFE
jgi:hypothetical protein